MHKELADAIRQTARGLTAADRFHFMAGVAWALGELKAHKRFRPTFSMLQHKSFRDGRQMLHDS